MRWTRPGLQRLSLSVSTWELAEDEAMGRQRRRLQWCSHRGATATRSWKRQETILFSWFQRQNSPANTLISDFKPQNDKRIILVFRATQIVVTCYEYPWKLTHYQFIALYFHVNLTCLFCENWVGALNISPLQLAPCLSFDGRQHWRDTEGEHLFKVLLFSFKLCFVFSSCFDCMLASVCVEVQWLPHTEFRLHPHGTIPNETLRYLSGPISWSQVDSSPDS